MWLSVAFVHNVDFKNFQRIDKVVKGIKAHLSLVGW